MPNNQWSWKTFLVVWALIGFGALFFGGLGGRAYKAMRGPGYIDFGWDFVWVLLVFAVGGGITIGLLVLAWRIIVQMGYSWTLGMAVLILVLFALIVWPTFYKYYRTDTPDILLKINRLTGSAEYIPRP